MAVIKVNKTKNYTVMSNRHFKERKMSLKAKGLLSMMLSLPADWDYSINGLTAICKENETTVKSTLNELKEFGYLVVTKKMPNETTTGRFEYIYDIYEQPQKKQGAKKQDTEKQGIEKQGVEKQPLEFQAVENSPQLNTNISNTKELNTDYKIHQSINPKEIEETEKAPATLKDYERYDRLIKTNIGYDVLLNEIEQSQLDEIVSIMIEICCSNAKTIRVGKENKHSEVVRSQFLKLNSFHIRYVINRMQETPTKIKNVKSYIVTCLYNAPITMENYYTALVNADMHEMNEIN